MLEVLVKNTQESDSLSDLRLAIVCLLSFAGFLRFNELVNLKPLDIKIEGNMMKIHIVCSKTDQLRQGDEVVVARTHSATCPVAMLENYMVRTGMAWDDQRFLFRPIQKSKKGENCDGVRMYQLYLPKGPLQEEVKRPWLPTRGIWPP